MPHRQHDHRATARDVTFPAITRGQRPPRPRSHADASHWKPAPSGGKFSIAATIQESMTSARRLTTQTLLSESSTSKHQTSKRVLRDDAENWLAQH
ncbi:unnamed protein product [Prunus armeniaca]|uniref:Uncharacterized protein n=1 Tax=Prunus armeniaca TaxID=36596 RepID=A0A6J5XV44_PRUAR|nr:hypothetical protein GBA52_024622 [Prunus armeniaca]CAB4316163.1 unnamed protein product [Prunus armeniaca]